MSNSNSIVVGSSSESKYGIGSLHKWNSEDVISIHRDEEGGWIVEVRLEDGGFQSFACYEVMKFEADLLGATIETCDLEG